MPITGENLKAIGQRKKTLLRRLKNIGMASEKLYQNTLNHATSINRYFLNILLQRTFIFVSLFVLSIGLILTGKFRHLFHSCAFFHGLGMRIVHLFQVFVANQNTIHWLIELFLIEGNAPAAS